MSATNGVDKDLFDVIILGAGPGGLAAGLYTARAKLKAVVLEKGLPGGQINKTGLIEDYPGFGTINAQELAQKMADHAKEFGADIRTVDATAVRKKGEIFEVETGEGVLHAKTVILGTGGSPNFLGCKGEDTYQTKGVSYCAICDGGLPLFRNKPMVVVGGGDSALEEALYLAKFASEILLVHRRSEFRASKIIQERVKENPKIKYVMDTVVDEIGGSDLVEWAKIRNLKTNEAKTVQVSGVFIYVGFTPNSGLVKDPMQKDGLGYILTNQNMETSIPGLFAIGDVRQQLTKQITNAVGDGTTAAVAAEKFIHGILQKSPVGAGRVGI